MSEPRKLYTGSASGGLDQEQYEALVISAK